MASGTIPLYANRANNNNYQVIVYGATPAGIMAAMAAKRLNVSVLLIEPGAHIGGVVAGGLGRTDIDGPQFIGGLSRDFLNEVSSRVPREYQSPGRPWDLEPKVAMEVFKTWINREKILLQTKMPLKSVTKKGNQIISLTFENGITYTAQVFIDATYEGDLMAMAGIPYRVGRESAAEYGEPSAGFHQNPVKLYEEDVYCKRHPDLGGPSGNNPRYLHDTQFGANISPYAANGQLLWGINRGPKPQPGTGDSLVQAYCFRVPVTNRPDLKVPWPKPAHYYPDRYELLLRYINAHPCIAFTKLVHTGRLPNGKFDCNSCGPFTIDYVGGNTKYPEGAPEIRKQIVQDHEDYQKGFFWFLANDTRVPERLRKEAREFGLCRDEFTDNGHWPYQLYIRESRRMEGAYIMKEHDITVDVYKDDAIGMASFIADAHPVQRIVNEKGFVEEEGHLARATRPYEIPYQSLVPRATDCTNLIVPVCLSASHVAYCSIRMEPVFMIMGHASGIAAAMAATKLINVQDVNIAGLQKKLIEQGQVLQNPAKKK
jgi:hypothetical protein